MFNEISGFRVDYLLWFFIFRIELGVEDVLSDDNADSVEHAVESMYVIGKVSEVIVDEEESEVGDCLGNNLEAANSLLGQFIKRVVAKAFPVAFS